MSHTPGPWIAYYIQGDENRISVFDTNNHTICRGVQSENACLIATAPDLLEELENTRQDLAQMVEDGIIEYYDFSTIDAAIAKAKGDENA